MSRVLVAGSINMDIVVGAGRHPRPGETVHGSTLNYYPGGKGANQAIAAAKAGAEVAMIGAVGTDAFGAGLVDFLNGQRVDVKWVEHKQGIPTGTALIVVASAENTIVVVPGANGAVVPGDLPVGSIRQGDVLVSQFETPQTVVEQFFAAGRRLGTCNILNPAPAGPCPRSLLTLVDILILNEIELSTLASIDDLDPTDESSVIGAAKQLRATQTQAVIVTLGPRGAIGVLGDTIVSCPGRPVTAVDTTGAGDCFVGSLAARLAQGIALEVAMKYANVAASICVQRPGAGVSMPTQEEVDHVAAAK